MLLKNKKILATFSAIFVLVCAVVVLLLFSSSKKKETEISVSTETPAAEKSFSASSGKTYSFDPKPLEEGRNVGSVEVKLDDLEDRYNLYYPDTNEQRVNSENWQKIASMVTDDAILVNEGIKDGIYDEEITSLTPRIVNIARDYYETEGTSYITGEAVMLWFYNVNPPEMGLEIAKQKQKNLIDQFRLDVLNNKYSMEQVGDVIRSMSELEEIDPSYQSNAHFTFEYQKKDKKKFIDPSLDDLIWQLGKGEVSNVLVGHDYDGKNWYEAYFVIVKMTDKKIQEFDSIDDLIKTRKESGMQIIIE